MNASDFPNDDAAEAPLPERVVSDVETLKALSDPVRLRILETMIGAADEAWTVKRLAAALGVGPTKLYHHIGILEEHDFIRLAGTRVVSGIIEKRYRIAQLTVRLDRALLHGGSDEALASVRDVMAVIFGSVRDDIERAIRAGLITGGDDDPIKNLLIRGLTSLTTERAAELRERLRALLDEFDTIDGGPAEPGGRPFGYLIALYPIPDAPAAGDDDKEPTDV